MICLLRVHCKTIGNVLLLASWPFLGNCSESESKQAVSSSKKDQIQVNIVISGANAARTMATSEVIEGRLKAGGIGFDVNSGGGSIVLEASSTTIKDVKQAIGSNVAKEVTVKVFEVAPPGDSP